MLVINMKEYWKKIKWYENYYISNLWNIYSIKRWLIKKRILDKDWYVHVRLSKNWIKTVKILHRLVLESFVINTENKRTVNHINWIKTDNRLENLEWATDLENVRHYHKFLKK